MFYDVNHPDVTLSDWEAFKASEAAPVSSCGGRRPQRLRVLSRLVRALGTWSRHCESCTVEVRRVIATECAVRAIGSNGTPTVTRCA